MAPKDSSIQDFSLEILDYYCKDPFDTWLTEVRFLKRLWPKIKPQPASNPAPTHLTTDEAPKGVVIFSIFLF